MALPHHVIEVETGDWHTWAQLPVSGRCVAGRLDLSIPPTTEASYVVDECLTLLVKRVGKNVLEFVAHGCRPKVLHYGYATETHGKWNGETTTETPFEENGCARVEVGREGVLGVCFVLQIEGGRWLKRHDGQDFYHPMDAGKVPHTGAYHTRHPLYFEAPLSWNFPIDRCLALFRPRAFWLQPTLEDVPEETQMLMVQLSGTGPYPSGTIVASTNQTGGSSVSFRRGTNRNQLVVRLQSPWPKDRPVPAFFAVFGLDLYETVDVCSRLFFSESGISIPQGQIPRKVPRLAHGLGWCTWDGCGADVRQESVDWMLSSLAANGVPVSWMVLDDGWLKTANQEGSLPRLDGLDTNEKFPEGLAGFVHMCRDKYNLKDIVLWHTVVGYWGGITERLADEIGVKTTDRAASFPLGLRNQLNGRGDVDYWGKTYRIAEPDDAGIFFETLHRHYKRCGVTGVKIDGHALLELVGISSQSEADTITQYRTAASSTSQKYFSDGVINCMGGSNQYFAAPAGREPACWRLSDDHAFPGQDESAETVARHIWTNAVMGAWVRAHPLIYPDWDMFVSSQWHGHIHAAARAIAGCPLYFSDAPGSHDIPLLRKLALANGKVPLPLDVGRPTADCLLVDPLREGAIYKIFNTNPCGGGVVGLFNLRPGQNESVRASVGVPDVSGLTARSANSYVGFTHSSGHTRQVALFGRQHVTLGPLQWEIITYAPVRCYKDGLHVAVIGLAEVFNSGGTVTRLSVSGEDPVSLSVSLLGPGTLVVWCTLCPTTCKATDGAASSREDIIVDFDYQSKSQTLYIDVPASLSDPQIYITF